MFQQLSRFFSTLAYSFLQCAASLGQLRRELAVLAVAVLMLHAPGVAAQCQNDHGCEFAEATDVSLTGSGSKVKGKIEKRNEKDFFRIEVPADGILTVTTTGSTDTRGQLFLGTRNLRKANEDDAGGKLNFLMKREVKKGQYFVRVRHQSTGTGAYFFKVKFQEVVADDFGNNADKAELIDINSTTNGSIESKRDVDFFKLNVPQRGTLTLETTGPSDTKGHLFSANGNSRGPVVANDNDNGSDKNFFIAVVLDPGTYYLRVKLASNNATGDYVLRSDFQGGGSTGGADDHGNERSAATDVDANSSTAGVLEVGEDVDYFKFTLSSRATLKASSIGSTDTIGTLYNSNGVQLRTNNNSGSGNNFSISESLDAGVYFIRVSHSSDTGTGAYTLVLDSGGGSTSPSNCGSSDDHGNSLSRATSISANSTTSGCTSNSADDDFFKFSVPSSSNISIQVTSDQQVTTEVQSSSGQILNENGTGVTGVQTTITGQLSAGTYFIRIRSASSSHANYSLVVSTSGGSSNTCGPNSRDDHGNSSSSATDLGTLSGSARITGCMEGGNVDVFMFKVSRDTVFTARRESGVSLTMELSEFVRSPAGNFEQPIGSPGSSIQANLFAGQTYLLRLSSGSVGSYVIALGLSTSNNNTCPNSADDHGSSTSNATRLDLSSGLAIADGCMEGSDADMFRFDITSPGRLTISAASASSIPVTLELSTNGVPVGSPGSSLDTTVQPGTYFLRITSSRTGIYNLRLDFSRSSNASCPNSPDDHGSSTSNATRLDLSSGLAIADGCMEGSDADMFRFDITSPGRLTISAASASSIPVTLELSTNGLPVGSPGSSLDTTVQPGTYFLRITSSRTGIYNLRLDFSGSTTNTGCSSDHGSSFNSATSINFPSGSVSGCIANAADIDVFSFRLSSTSNITIRIRSDVAVEADVFDGNGNSITTSGFGAITNLTVGPSTLPAGTYFIGIFASSGTPANYTVELN